MPCSTCRATAGRVVALSIVMASLGVLGCSSGDKSADPASTAGSGARVPGQAAMMPPDSMTERHNSEGMRGSQEMAGMSRDADHAFLRMMSDHHKGLILLAHMTKERKDSGPAAADAKRLDTKQDAELDEMMNMLEKSYKDAYAPKVMSAHRAMADGLKSKHGKEYERTFYQDIVKHHQDAITMIDDYLPRATNAAVKQMAEKMKADQTMEIRDFEKKVAQTGS